MTSDKRRKENRDEMTAFERFVESERGILKIVRALDLYAVHLIAKLREEAPPKDTIEAIMSENKISGLNKSDASLTIEEKNAIKTDGYFKEVGEQIIVATHSAFEHYLIEKFKEFFGFHMRYCARPPREAAIRSVTQSMRSLDGIKNAYKEVLGIHLPSFNIEFTFNPNSNFAFDATWDAIIAMDKKRHSIVHPGCPAPFEIESLMDSWFPFEFTRYWVTQFDAFFDHQIYEGGWFKSEKTQSYFKKAESAKVVLVQPFSPEDIE